MTSSKTSESSDWITVSSLKDQESTNPGSQVQVVVSLKRRADDDGQMPSKRMRSSYPISSGEAPSGRARFSETSNKPEFSPEAEETSQEDQSRADFEQQYIELWEIGRGGFGSVFAGVRTADGLPVAIKHVPVQRASCDTVTFNGTSHTLFREVAFMIATGGPSESVGQHAAVTLLDWYQTTEELILVMERPKNAMDLFHYLEALGRHLEEHEAKMILKQLVDAAIHMESKRVFHRDIKMQNILVQPGSNGPRVRIVDFGCGARASEDAFTSFAGTYKFAPPEWLKKRKYWAHSTTVWQLGVVFYSLLGGHKSFNTKAFMRSKIQVNQALSGDVKTLLAMCLAINPEERATLQDLQRILAL